MHSHYVDIPSHIVSDCSRYLNNKSTSIPFGRKRKRRDFRQLRFVCTVGGIIRLTMPKYFPHFGCPCGDSWVGIQTYSAYLLVVALGQIQWSEKPTGYSCGWNSDFLLLRMWNSTVRTCENVKKTDDWARWDISNIHLLVKGSDKRIGSCRLVLRWTNIQDQPFMCAKRYLMRGDKPHWT